MRVCTDYTSGNLELDLYLLVPIEHVLFLMQVELNEEILFRESEEETVRINASELLTSPSCPNSLLLDLDLP